MRGKRVGAARVGCGVGITPAHAGKRLTLSVRSSIDLGSPPHVRGKALDTVIEHAFDGITPACAGKRIKLRKRHSICGDHPRVCGEKTKPVPAGGILMGSPPRMRGKVLQNPISQGIVGITPARAGKRVLCLGLPVLRWDHPRVCGEKLRARGKISAPWGLPPRMRGKDEILDVLEAVLGITPACAGKSVRRENSSS